MYGSAIKRLVVENFFTWTRRQELKFPESGKVVVVGENGSGKSNLLRAVELLARWFPKLVTCEEESAWDGTKSAELTLEMVVPSNLREELIRGVALELLRMIQPDLWSQAGGVGRTRIAEIYSQIRSVLDVGGLFKCVTVSYLTRPEWQGHLRPFCQTRWEKKLVSLLSHGARTGFRILSDDWNHESVYNPNAQTDTDDYLAALIAKRVLKEHEKALWGKQGYNTWKLDQLAGVSGLAAEVSLYRKLLLKEQGDRWNREKAIENSFAVSLETQRARIERQYGALISVEQAKDLESAKIQARNGMGSRRSDQGQNIEDHLPIEAIIARFLSSTIALLREDRGLLDHDRTPVTVVTLHSVEELLFSAKNSRSPLKRSQFREVQTMMRGLSGWSMEVVEPDSDDESHERSFEDEGGGGVGKRHEIVFSKEGLERQFGISEAFGGAYEILLVATTLLVSEAQFIILDEPGRNLQGPLRKKLCDAIYLQSEKSVLIITHDAEMLSAKRLDDVFYCNHSSVGEGSRLVELKSLAVDQRTRNFMAGPDFRETFFSQNVIFVEGMGDIRFLEAINMWLELTDGPNRPQSHELPWLNRVMRIRSAIVPLRGIGEGRKAMSIANALGIRWILICDFDGVLPKKASPAERWVARKTSPVVKFLLEDLRLQGSILDSDIRPASWAPLLDLCRGTGIFSWEVDLEEALIRTQNKWEKENWSNFPLDDLVDMVKALMGSNNAEVILLFRFLFDRGAFSMEE